MNKIPEYDCNWTSQMTEFLSDKSDMFILENIEDICDSWGDSSKWDKITSVLDKVVEKDILCQMCALWVQISWAGE